MILEVYNMGFYIMELYMIELYNMGFYIMKLYIMELYRATGVTPYHHHVLSWSIVVHQYPVK